MRLSNIYQINGCRVDISRVWADKINTSKNEQNKKKSKIYRDSNSETRFFSLRSILLFSSSLFIHSHFIFDELIEYICCFTLRYWHSIYFHWMCSSGCVYFLLDYTWIVLSVLVFFVFVFLFPFFSLIFLWTKRRKYRCCNAFNRFTTWPHMLIKMVFYFFTLLLSLAQKSIFFPLLLFHMQSYSLRLYDFLFNIIDSYSHS